MPDKAPCDICENQAEYELIPPLVTWRCPRCGEFCYNSSESPPKITRRNGTTVGMGARTERGWRRPGPHNNGDIASRCTNATTWTA
jgi:hypothetical protein